jgi:uncharacterized membrane protein
MNVTILRLGITLLCGIGLYVSLRMLRKTRLAERGEIDGPSVVKEPHARLFFGVPNALFGTCYYAFLIVATWIGPATATGASGRGLTLEWIVLACVTAAAATSAYLAYSLLFVTRRACPYCWAAHAINGLLLALVPLSFFT